MSALAEENSDLREGDRVMALVGGGGYAGQLKAIASPLQTGMLFFSRERFLPPP